MAESSNPLIVDPTRELHFEGPYTDIVTSFMTFKNPTTKQIYFKVKTTAPKQYCVRPSTGVVEPGELKEVKIILQPLEGSYKNIRHKFKVQYCFAPNDSVQEVDDVWTVVPQTEWMFEKLLVVFNDPPSQEVTESIEEPIKAHNLTSTPLAAPKRQDTGVVNRKPEQSAKEIVMQREIDDLLMRVRSLQQSSPKSDGNWPTLQVVLIAIATLLIGLIIGIQF